MLMQTRHVTITLVLALTLALITWAAARGGDDFSQPRTLRVATWNLQWLMSPETARAARIACREHTRTSIPCDVARALGRDTADFGRLAAQVRRLDADVIAFQEVENDAVARRVFAGYRICITRGAGVQHVGFAVRRGLRFTCDEPVGSLEAGGRGRAGQAMTLFLADGAPLQLLAVHLKSGCARDPIETASAACRLLRDQADALGEWIGQRADLPFIVLGDLNRGGLPGADDPFWSRLHPELFDAAATRLPFRNCVLGAPYGEFIDHILVGRALVPRLHKDGFRHQHFPPREAVEFRLSDHCPVSVSLSLSDPL